MVQCLCCGSENMLARVELEYDVPLSKRGFGVVVGKLQVGKLDVRDAWEKTKMRLLYCHSCGQAHIYEADTKVFRLAREGVPDEEEQYVDE